MCRGLGGTERLLFLTLSESNEPLTFTGIVERILSGMGHNVPFTVWREGRANVTRSLRRALRGLVDKGFVVEIGYGGRRQPFRYALDPGCAKACGKETSPEVEAELGAAITRAIRLSKSLYAPD